MKFALLCLGFVIVIVASIQGRTLKKNSLSQLLNKKWEKDTSKAGKKVTCFVIRNSESRKVRCSVVEICPEEDPTCRSSRPIRRISEIVDKKTLTSSSQYSVRAECPDKKNPLCIHDIWVGKKSDRTGNPSLKTQIKTKLCGSEDELCLLTIRRAKTASEMPYQDDLQEAETFKAQESDVILVDNNMGSFPASSSPDCDFRRNPNCKQEDYRETELTMRNAQKKQPTTKRQKITCKSGKINKICRWRPQPKILNQDQQQLQGSSSSSNSYVDNAGSNTKRNAIISWTT